MNLSGSFIDQSVEFYGAEPTKLLESSEENTQMINSWVANKTKNKITHLVNAVPTGTQLMLLNAVSYSGQWSLCVCLHVETSFANKLCVWLSQVSGKSSLMRNQGNVRSQN